MTTAPWAWSSLVLDSGGLTAAANNEPDARAAIVYASRHGVRVMIPSVVIAESTRGDASDARVNAVVSRSIVAPAGETEARIAARLKSIAAMTGVEHTIDALVVATAATAGGGAILTSDKDIETLAEILPRRAVRAIRV